MAPKLVRDESIDEIASPSRKPKQKPGQGSTLPQWMWQIWFMLFVGVGFGCATLFLWVLYGNRECTEPLGPWLLFTAVLSFVLQVLNCMMRPLSTSKHGDATEETSLREDEAQDEDAKKKPRVAAIIFFLVFCLAVFWFVCGNLWAYRAVHRGEDHCDEDLYKSTFWLIVFLYILAASAALMLLGLGVYYACIARKKELSAFEANREDSWVRRTTATGTWSSRGTCSFADSRQSDLNWSPGGARASIRP